MLHLLKYNFICYFRAKDMAFFSIAFPVILATLFNVAIGNIGDESDFKSIPVAIVVECEESANDNYFLQVINGMSEANGGTLTIVDAPLEDTKELLADGEVAGAYIIDADSVSLLVADEGINQSILKLILDRFVQVQHTLENIALERGDLIAYAIADITSEVDINIESNMGRGTIDAFGYITLTFFAMAILIGMMTGIYSTEQFLPHRSKEYPIFIRNFTSPTKKVKMILANYITAVVTQSIYSVIALCYFIFVLGVDFGSELPLVVLAVVLGCSFSISLGTFLGVVIKGSTVKVLAVAQLLTMASYFLGGMMGVQIRVFVRQHLPLLDRINPVSIIADALYSLIHFSDYRQYVISLVTMAAFSAFFCIVSALVLRRQSYDSI